jgi:hypothetical protein
MHRGHVGHPPTCGTRPAPRPSGVDDITAVVLILLEGNPKDKGWAAAAKLMNNVDKFLERLRCFKAVIDEGKARAQSGLQHSMP